MPDNPQGPAPRDFRLTGHGVIALSGPDAIAFAQAQFMNDVASLGLMDWHWSGWLTPKGRVIALFALLRRDEQTLWMVLPDADPETMRSALSRFVFRSKVRIEVLGDVMATGRFDAPARAGDAHAAVLESGAVELDLRADGADRTLHLGAADRPPDEAPGLQWRAADLRHGLPRLSDSQVEQWTPQQLSLDRLAAFSVKKGCYPGQEIVARTHFLGKVKRGLALLESDTPMDAGAEVRAGDTPLGTIASSCSLPSGGCVGLAVLPLERSEADLYVDGRPVHEGALLGGLARRPTPL